MLSLFLRYFASVIYKLRLNSWNPKYSHKVTCICKNILSVKHILLKIMSYYHTENGYITLMYQRKDILYNTDFINYIVKLIVNSPVVKLV